MPLIIRNIEGKSDDPGISTQKVLVHKGTTGKTAVNSQQSDEILQTRSHNSMTKCIRMLGQLSNYSKEIFSDLVTLVQDTNQRIVKLNNQVEALQKVDIESMTSEVFFASTKSSLWASVAVDESIASSVSPVPGTSSLNASLNTAAFHSKQYKSMGVSLVDRHTLPPSFRTTIHKLHVPPDFSVFEEYSAYFKILPSQKLILTNRYSYPEYFLGQWCEAQEKRLHSAQNEHKLRKQEKKKRHETRQSLNQQRRPSSNKQVLNWKDRFSIDGKKKEEDKKRPVGLKAQLSRRSFGNQSSPLDQEIAHDQLEKAVDSKSVMHNLFPSVQEEDQTEENSNIEPTKSPEQIGKSESNAHTSTFENRRPPPQPPHPPSSSQRRPSAHEVSIAESSDTGTPRDATDPRYSQVYNERIVSDRINPDLVSSPPSQKQGVAEMPKAAVQFTPRAPPPRPPPPPPARRPSIEPSLEASPEEPKRRPSVQEDSDSSGDESKAVRRRSRADSISSNIDSEQQFVPKSIAYYQKEDIVQDVAASIEKVNLNHMSHSEESAGKAEEIFGGVSSKPRPPRPPPPPPKLPPPASRMESSVAVENNSNKRLLVKSIRLQNFADILAMTTSEKSPVPTTQATDSNKIRSEASIKLSMDSPSAKQAASAPSFFSGDEERLLDSNITSPPEQPRPTAAMPPMGNLLQSIRRGSSLRKVETPDRKSISSTTSKTATTALGGFANSDSVQKILERRKYVQAEDSESEDSDEDQW